MKKIYFFLLAICLVGAACKENELKENEPEKIDKLSQLKASDNSDEDDNSNEGEFLYAKVENASDFSNVVEVKLVVMVDAPWKWIELARGDWKGDGFAIVLPKTIDSNYLYPLINNNGWGQCGANIIDPPPSTVTISNQNVKTLHARFMGVDKDGDPVTFFYPREMDKDGYAQDAFYTYVDSDVTICGYTEREDDMVTLTEYDVMRYGLAQVTYVWYDKITMTYSVKWKKGWNVWCFSRFDDGSTSALTEKWAPTLSRSLKWYNVTDWWMWKGWTEDRNP